MSVEIQEAKKWFQDNKDSIDSDDGLPTISSSQLFKRARALGNVIVISTQVYDDYDAITKRRFIYGLTNTGIFAPADDDDGSNDDGNLDGGLDDDDDEEVEVSLASALNYMLSEADRDPEMTKFLTCISAHYKDKDFSLVRRLCTTLAKKTAEVNGDQPFGVVKPLNHGQYLAWKNQQTETKTVMGPLLFWNICERLGLACTSHLSRAAGKEYLVYDRIGRKIHMFDRFMVHSNYAKGLEANEEEVNGFLEGLRFKGQSLLYKYISVGAYKAAMAFLSTFKVQLNKGSHATCSLILLKGEKVHLPDFDRNTRKMIDAIRVAFSEGKIKGDSFITAFENIARWAQKHKDKIGLSDALSELETSDADIDLEIKSYLNSFAVAAKQTGLVKGNTLSSMFGTKGKPIEACQNLEACRKLRNATPSNTVVNHGVGSVRGSNLPEWIDTYHKGRQMVQWATDNGPDVGPDTLISVYGVAYGHMTPVFTALRHEKANPKNLQFYDVAKAKDSTEVFINANVFSHDRVGAWVFDDTDAHHLPKNSGHEEAKTSGDHLKIIRFIEAKAPVIVSKVDLSNFCTAAHMTEWERILTTGNLYMYRLVKMGRLHNSECFLVATFSDDPTPFKNFRGDIWGISMCIDIANQIIMKWQNAGLRAGCRVPLVEFDNGRVTLGTVWRALIRALPVSWPWYLVKPDDVVFKTIAIMEEEKAPEEFGLDETHYEPDEDWVPSGALEVGLDPRFAKPKNPAIMYVNGVVYYPVPGEKLGYGTTDDLQQEIDNGLVDAVIWSVAFNGWTKYVKPKKKDKDDGLQGVDGDHQVNGQVDVGAPKKKVVRKKK